MRGLLWAALASAAATPRAALGDLGAAAPRTTGETVAAEWTDDALVLHSLGNHRVRLRCPAAAAAIADVEWRRPDDVPSAHGVWVTASPTSTATVNNVAILNISRVRGSVAIDTSGEGGEFFLYWLPFTKNHVGQWGAVAVQYDPPKDSADASWRARARSAPSSSLPRCTVVAYEARDIFNRFTAMEVVASAEEMAAKAAAGHASPFLVFSEDRDHTVRSFHRLPARWLGAAAAAAAGGCAQPADSRAVPLRPHGCFPAGYQGAAQPGEFFVFQLVVWALQPLTNVQLQTQALHSEHSKIDVGSIRSISTRGISYLGVPFEKEVNVSQGLLQPLFVGVDVARNLSAGNYSGTFTVSAGNTASAVDVSVQLSVSGAAVGDHGDGDPSKLTRLRWLDSTAGWTDEPTRGFGPLSLAPAVAADAEEVKRGQRLVVTGNAKTFELDQITGLPASVVVSNDKGARLSVLQAPVELRVLGGGAWCAKPGSRSFAWTKQSPGRFEWAARAVSCAGLVSATTPTLELAVNGSLSFDGFFDFRVRVTCRGTPGSHCRIGGHALLLNFSETATRFAMGAGARGQEWPPPAGQNALEWRWAEAANATAHGVAAKMGWLAWVGDVDHGMRLKLKGPEDVWDGPLNPLSVCDEGTHKCAGPGGSSVRVPTGWGGEAAGLSLSREGVLSAHSGPRTLADGESIDLRFDLVTTPGRPRRDKQHWKRRYLMGCGGCDVAGAAMHPPLCKPSPSNYGYKVENVTAMGFTAVTIHQGCPLNPFINWPFDVDVTQTLSTYTAARHRQGVSVQMYYTVRELSNRAAELPVLRSLGQEILVDGNTSGPGGLPPVPGGQGGVSWLQEHVRHHYKTGWTTDVLHNQTDAAIQNIGASRWSNYYIEGMSRMACSPPYVDGVELDGLAYPRHTTERLRKVTEACRGNETVFNEHISDNFPGDGATGMLMYMEHLPFIDSLVTGEVFDYTKGPVYYLLEMSGIPFGLMTDTYGWGAPPHGEPNLAYSMTIGATARMPNGPGILPVQETWKLWDAFEIESAEMVGWWRVDGPVRVQGRGAEAVKATVYVKQGDAALITMANFAGVHDTAANATANVTLGIDWPALGLPSNTSLCAPQLLGIQRTAPNGTVVDPSTGLPVVIFRDGDVIPVLPRSGWWLLLTTRDILECRA